MPIEVRRTMPGDRRTVKECRKGDVVVDADGSLYLLTEPKDRKDTPNARSFSGVVLDDPEGEYARGELVAMFCDVQVRVLTGTLTVEG